MTRDDIIRIAREAGIVIGRPVTAQHLDTFAALVSAAEREACATVCEKHYDTSPAAAAIRARGRA